MKISDPSSSTSAKGKTTPCCSKVGIKRGPWTPEEDELLAAYIRREGEGRWRTLPKRAGLLRCGKSCRLRWMNYLRPSVKHGRIAPDEEDLILRLHRLLGNRWSLIAGRIPGRTDNEIKNYWNTHLSKKLISRGIDPRTHKPLNPNYENSSNSFNHHEPIPNQNLNPTPKLNYPFELDNQSPILTSSMQNFPTTTNLKQFRNQVGEDHNTQNWCDSESDFLMGLTSNHVQFHEQDIYVDHRNGTNEDTFSSFLDSLINDNVFANHEQHQSSVNPLVSPAQTFGWEAEVVSGLHEEQSGSYNHHG